MNFSPKDHLQVDSGQAQRLNDLIARMTRCCQDRVLRESGRFGLLPAEMRCLMEFKGQRYLTAKALGRNLELAKSRISKILEGLIEKGLLERWTDPKDGRYRLLNLTDQGKARLSETGAYLQNAHAMILARFDPGLRDTVLDSLELLAAAMDQVKEDLFRDTDSSEQEPLPSGAGPGEQKGAQNGKR